MPDLTSTLLAMYQAIIGGSSAREQSSLEAECARRVLTAGLTIDPTGTVAITKRLFVGFPSPPVTIGAGVAGSATGFGTAIVAVKNLDGSASGAFVGFLNASGVLAGSVNHTSLTTVTYNTTSDARLKHDLGPADDLSALRAVRVHDFVWRHGAPRRARGVFAQEAHAVFPAAVTPGSDATTPEGHLVRPWMTDYSKFVPDLIAGWQAHDAAIAALQRARHE